HRRRGRRDAHYQDSLAIPLSGSHRQQRKGGPAAGKLRRAMPGLPVRQGLHRVFLGCGGRRRVKAMVKITYLQMLARRGRVEPPPREGLAVVHARKPTVAYYRFLFDTVGRKWNWIGRESLSDAALFAIIHDPRDEIHVLFVDGVPAGFVELDR